MARNFSEFYYCTVYLNVLLVVLCFFQYICDGAQSMMMKVYERPVGQKKVAAVSQVCVCEGLSTGIGGIVGQAQLTNFWIIIIIIILIFQFLCISVMFCQPIVCQLTVKLIIVVELNF